MSALHLVLNELAINVLPAKRRAGLIANLARQHGLDDALTLAMQSGDAAALTRLSSTVLSGCAFIVATEVPKY